MKRILIPSIFVLLLIGVFIAGIVTQLIWLLMPSFCLWTPAIFWLGYAVSKAGIAIRLTADDSPQVSKAEHKRRQKAGTAYQ